MGHRHMMNSSQTFNPDSDQGCSHQEQAYMPLARVSASESSSLIHPVDNMPVQGGQFTSPWSSAPRSNGYSSSILNPESPYYQPQAPSSYRDPFPHQSADGRFRLSHDNYPYHSSSDSHYGKLIPEDDAHSYQTMGRARGRYKRKSPGNSPVCDEGSTSRCYDVGSSSNVHLPVDPREGKQNADLYYSSYDYPPPYGVNNLSNGIDFSLQNVRSREADDLETNIPSTQLSSNSVHNSISSQSADHSSSMDVWNQNSNASTREWNHNLPLPPVCEVTYGSGSCFFNHGPEPLNMCSNQATRSMELGSNNNDMTSNMCPIPRNLNNNSIRSARGVRIGYGHRPIPSFRASSSTFTPGFPNNSEGHDFNAESYTSKHLRAFPCIRMCSIDRNGRTLTPSDRHRPSNEGTSFYDRLIPGGLMVSNTHPGFYGSRNMFDQHRDMRLDTENMSYEELLALGERIGSVSTGLSDDSVSKCLTVSIYCSSDIFQDEEKCVICLEEYKSMDDVGCLKACTHDFHTACIRKWLSMKNLCPICKATALDDNMKNM